MISGFRGWLNLIIGLLLLTQSVLPMFGITLFSLGSFEMYVLLLALVLIIIDGFLEDHALKTLTLLVALVLAIFVAIPLLNSAGWLPFSLPGSIMFIYPWVLASTGVLMVIGAFTNG